MEAKRGYASLRVRPSAVPVSLVVNSISLGQERSDIDWPSYMGVGQVWD